MTFVLGLTGSIGMGKSTTAAMFAKRGVPVWDADAEVAKLYTTDGPVSQAIGSLVPGSVADGQVDRSALKAAIDADPGVLSKLEGIVSPAVASSRQEFIDQDVPLVLIDHPLLFESGTADICDAVVVVTVSAAEQKRRVLDRGTMTEDMLRIILSKQMPDAEKRSKADFIIETSTLDTAKEAVERVLADIEGAKDA